MDYLYRLKANKCLYKGKEEESLSQRQKRKEKEEAM